MIYTVQEISRLLEPVFQEHKIRKAILFGSYAYGIPTEDSDTDILVDSGLRGLQFYGLLEDIVETLNKEVDLFDYRQFNSESEMFIRIQNEGIVIYNRES